jgi:hypothetical protein
MAVNLVSYEIGRCVTHVSHASHDSYGACSYRWGDGFTETPLVTLVTILVDSTETA